MWYADAASAFTHRQVWGLVVRHERALRAISPIADSNSNTNNNISNISSNSSGDSVHQLFQSVRWLTPALSATARGGGVQATLALLRILASYAASSVKEASQHGGGYIPTVASMASMQVLRCWGVCFQTFYGKQGEAQEEAAAKAAAAPVIYLLLPRLAALSSTNTAAMGLHVLSQVTDCVWGHQTGHIVPTNPIPLAGTYSYLLPHFLPSLLIRS